ncbi:hypothetical protein Ptr902_03550 [Pyrenophora tritici-repentis]|nr:hypothetical protein Ptr902_03550 [Pyrenophora tritici-repentis]
MPMAPHKNYSDYPVAVGYPQPAHSLQIQQVYSPILAQVTLCSHTLGHALTISTLTSIPVGGGGEDSTQIVKEFLKWLIEQQLEDDQNEYEWVQEVAMSEEWTVKDLKEILTLEESYTN